MWKKLWRRAEAFIDWLRRGEISCSSTRIAYYVMLSLFPMLMALGAALPLFGIGAEEFSQYLNHFIPQPLLENVRPYIAALLASPGGSRLSFGIIATVLAAGSGMRVVQTGINRAYGIDKTRHFLVSAILPVAILVLLMIMLLMFIMIISFGENALGALFGKTEGTAFGFAFGLLRWAAPFVGLFLVFAALYKISPNIRHRRGDALAGAFFAAAAVMVMVNLFALYLRLVHPFIAGYGAGAAAVQAAGVLSSFFVLMIWIKLLADVILLGAMINAAVYKKRYGTPRPRRNPIDEFLANSVKKLLGQDKNKPSGDQF